MSAPVPWPAIVAILVFACASAAAAQGLQRNDPDRALRAADVLDEVVVTARRRDEKLKDVPASISVVSEVQLRRAQIEDVNALQFAVPSLTVAPNQSSRSSASIAMRGQVERDTVPTLDPAVGLFLNGVYLARMTGANLNLVDIERVEVIRGPQGTLFGRNTIGGAINIVPRSPGGTPEATLEAGIGNYDQRSLSAIVNVPILAEHLGTRVVAAHHEHSGYGYNLHARSDFDDKDTDYLRTQLRFTPNDQWQLDLSADFTDSSTAGPLRNLIEATAAADLITTVVGNPDDSLANYVDPDARAVFANRSGYVRSTVWGISATLTAEFSSFTTRLTTAYRELDENARDIDQDGTPYDYGAVSERVDHQHQVSHDLQLHGTTLGDRLDWIAGLSHFDERATFRQVYPLFFPTNLRWQEARPEGEASNDSFAIYAHAEYALTPRISFNAGARYNEDTRQLTSRNQGRTGAITQCRLDPALLDTPGVCQATLPEREFRYMPFTTGITFRPHVDTALYATVSRGHRAGGYNLRGGIEAELGTFEPEQVTSYELGAKARLFGDRLRLGAAVFHSQFDDIQLLQRDPAPELLGRNAWAVRNVGEAKVDGAELDFNAAVGPMQLRGNFGLTRARYTRLEPGIEGVTLDSVFVHTPDWTGFVAADLPIALSVGELNLHADFAWRDDIAFWYDPAIPARQPAYGVANAMITLRPGDGDLELNIWCRNLTDQHYFVRILTGDVVTGIPGDPRTFGATVIYRFRPQ